MIFPRDFKDTRMASKLDVSDLKLNQFAETEILCHSKNRKY